MKKVILFLTLFIVIGISYNAKAQNVLTVINLTGCTFNIGTYDGNIQPPVGPFSVFNTPNTGFTHTGTRLWWDGAYAVQSVWIGGPTVVTGAAVGIFPPCNPLSPVGYTATLTQVGVNLQLMIQ